MRGAKFSVTKLSITKVKQFGWVLFPFAVGVAQGTQEVMPSLPRRLERTQPDDTALQITSERQREIEAVEREMKEKRRALEAGQPPAIQATMPPSPMPETGGFPEEQGKQALGALEGAGDGKGKEGEGKGPSETSLNGTPRNQRHKRGPRAGQVFGPSHAGVQPGVLGSPLQTFAVSQAPEGVQKPLTVLPTGSHVKARIVSGVEANAREPYPVLLQLDYAFTGPNQTRIDLSHCFMIAKARANMSTERVMMETENLSCVLENGEHFKLEAKGYVAGEDNTFGATGTYISKQSQVLLAAVLASIAKNAGQAIADAQKTTSVLGIDKAATATNITGSKSAFIAGSALVDGGAMVAQWYLEQAKELLPSIGVGSGQDVFVVMLDTLKIPQIQTQE